MLFMVGKKGKKKNEGAAKLRDHIKLPLFILDTGNHSSSLVFAKDSTENKSFILKRRLAPVYMNLYLNE